MNNDNKEELVTQDILVGMANRILADMESDMFKRTFGCSCPTPAEPSTFKFDDMQELVATAKSHHNFAGQRLAKINSKWWLLLNSEGEPIGKATDEVVRDLVNWMPALKEELSTKGKNETV